ncbi:MAG: sigma-70 family RNA polymerase sigma factor [Planctomycetota bacterium]
MSTYEPKLDLNFAFEQHRPLLRRCIAARLNGKLRGRVDPSDVIQETYLEACRRLSEYLKNPSVSLLQWLLFLAEQNANLAYRRHVLAKKRSTERETRMESEEDGAPSWSFISGGLTDPMVRLDRIDRKELLLRAVEMLSPTSQQIVRMRFLEGQKLAEIADELGMTVDAVSKRTMRSLLKLHKIAQDMGLDEDSV